MNVFVTGGTGFVGKVLLERLVAERADLTVAGRLTSLSQLPSSLKRCEFDLARAELLNKESLRGVQVVMHLAARVHVMRPTAADEVLFHRMNVEATEVLARSAAAAGVQRFIYLSSIKVNGERTVGRPFLPDDAPAPEDAYGRSKCDAEFALRKVAAETGLEVVIIRPPLVYGEGVGANFQRLMSLVERGLPLPLGAINNRRSLVNVWNLVDLLVHVATHPAASGGLYLVSDGEDVSTPGLLRLIGGSMARRVRLFRVPTGLLGTAGRVSGRAGEVSRLVDSLQVDIGHTNQMLNWQPPVSVQDGLQRTVNAYLESRCV